MDKNAHEKPLKSMVAHLPKSSESIPYIAGSKKKTVMKGCQ